MNFLIIFVVVSSMMGMYTCVTDCQVELDMDYKGIPTSNDISYQSATSFQDCCNICSNDPTQRCQAWTFVYDTKVCWLKTQVGLRVINTGSEFNFFELIEIF